MQVSCQKWETGVSIFRLYLQSLTEWVLAGNGQAWDFLADFRQI